MKKLLLILLVTVLACKNAIKENEAKESTTQAQEVKKELVVKIKFKTNKEDLFKIMLNNIAVDEFQKKNIVIRETVPQTSSFENITANFGENNISNNIHINLGKETKRLELNTIEFTYGENVLVITKDNFNKYLRLNKFAEFNQDDFSITTKKEGSNHNPEINLKGTAISFLKKEKQPKNIKK